MIGSEIVFVAMYIYSKPARFRASIKRRTAVGHFLEHSYNITADRADSVARAAQNERRGKVVPWNSGWDWSIAEEEAVPVVEPWRE